MLGRDSHIISNMSLNLFAISYVNHVSTHLPHFIKERECMCETMNPGPFLIIRNNFSTTFKHFLHSAILKSENTKTLLLLAFTYKTPKISSIIVSTILALLLTTIAYLFTVLHPLLSLISFSHLVLDNHLVRLRAQSNLLCLQEI